MVKSFWHSHEVFFFSDISVLSYTAKVSWQHFFPKMFRNSSWFLGNLKKKSVVGEQKEWILPHLATVRVQEDSSMAWTFWGTRSPGHEVSF